MKFRNAPLSAVLAAALVSSSAVANAAPVDGTRTGTAIEGELLSGGFGPAWLVAAILVGALALVVLSDDDEDPVSP